ncbi:hypothetical protein MPTK1_5g11340 [Marchantia polymorpha subsp. ruderalis]|uniref:Transmembrane protein n=2 Tax=Marchantia polymorpha TaxID=3197 RepID=A0AAF6BH87_MARPO|nr:hypothetical protein MARPO_0093s0057 [Marchantia polymorpha]PTQ32984.1 hypothetical protein MARPO_0093s0057 [Marchantia polymorpha]BBN11371.1 hypothetical protein Mp_5g11340 [Marchantia polymorpha subsp. ruderalis]BBN11372.1 hypothetical protein Mp_5g11340 [Marchantia polymorpha subsp. ruderalis]|eukprot:PTQ32983.1 hypothetical protein MARPO_0093s0057 [Marchantia polymorpha]
MAFEFVCGVLARGILGILVIMEHMDETFEQSSRSSLSISAGDTAHDDGRRPMDRNNLHFLFILALCVTTFRFILQKTTAFRHWCVSRKNLQWCHEAINVLLHCLQVVVPVLWASLFLCWAYHQGLSNCLTYYIVGVVTLRIMTILRRLAKWLASKAHEWSHE